MKYLCTLTLGLILIISCSDNTKIEKTFSFPPEWEEHEAIWTDFNYEPYNAIPIEKERLELIKTLSRYVRTKVVYDNDSLIQVAKKELQNLSANFDSIEFIKLPFQSSWMRDPLMFVTNGNKNKLLDFEWTCYGAYDCNSDRRGELSKILGTSQGLEIDSMDIAIEGGAIEVSNNTIIAYKSIYNQRNPNLPIHDIEKVLLEKLGKSQIIWLDEFPSIDKPFFKVDNYFGFGANGHIDVTTRFLNDSTILTTVISEEDRYKNSILEHDYLVLQKSLDQLKKARQPNGKPYNILTVESPDYSLYQYATLLTEDIYYGVLDDDSRKLKSIGDSIIFLPALEHANYMITNGAVITSKYWKEGMPESEKKKDEKLAEILKSYFPNRDIITMDVLAINWGGGGIHCRTAQEPKITSR